MQDRPIFITGCARSGTSLIAGIIEKAGAWVGKTAELPEEWKELQPTGFKENLNIRENVIKRLLKEMGCDELGQNSLPDIDNIDVNKYSKIVKNTIEHIKSIEGYSNGPWLYKDAKLCLLWPIFVNAYPYARWIFCRRDEVAIAKSCLRASKFMKGHSTINDWVEWVREYNARMKQMISRRIDYFEIYPSDIINGNEKERRRFKRHLYLHYGLNITDELIDNFIIPGAWHDST